MLALVIRVCASTLRFTTVIVVLALFGAPANAEVAVFGFRQMNTGNFVNGLTVTVSSAGTTPGGNALVDFTFRALSGTALQGVSNIWFDDRCSPMSSLMHLEDIIEDNSNGHIVHFSSGATPSNPPNHNQVCPSFQTSAFSGMAFSADADPGGVNRVNQGEFVILRFSLKSGKTFANVIACMTGARETPPPCIAGLRIAVNLDQPGGGSSAINIATPFFGGDCDEDGVPDECEISCSGAGGFCDVFPGCGMTADCDGNNIPDNCETVCSDGDSCTIDACVAGIGCTHTQIPECCNDLLDCDDQDPCTTDTCENNVCVHTASTDCCTSGDQCDDSEPCTDDACVDNVCAHTPSCCTSNEECEAGDPCTIGTCIDQACVFTPIEGCCTVPGDCNDNDDCTIDACVNNSCSHDPVPGCCNLDGECDDSDPCTSDACVNHVCTTQPDCCDSDDDCNDDDPCTMGACLQGACQFTPVEGCCNIDSDCDDSDLCTADTCSDSTCQNLPIPDCCHTDQDCADKDECNNDDCVSNQCVHTPSCCEIDEDCDDGDPCTNGTCIDGTCEYAPVDDCCQSALDCDDENPCTTDICTENACSHESVPGCCVSGSACGDNDPCTTDACFDNSCVHSSDDDADGVGNCTDDCPNSAPGATVNPDGCACDDLTADSDCNDNGIRDECETDCNQNNVPDDCDISAGTSDDDDNNNVPDECQLTPTPTTSCTNCDCNNNGVPDANDPDADDDSIPDDCDNCPGVANLDQADSDGDGIGDSCQPPPVEEPPPEDCRPALSLLFSVLAAAPVCGSGCIVTMFAGICFMAGLKIRKNRSSQQTSSNALSNNSGN